MLLYVLGLVMAYTLCSMLGRSALGACLLLRVTLGHTPYVQIHLDMGGLGEKGDQRSSVLAAATGPGVFHWS